MRARVALFRARQDAWASAARLRRLGFSVACLPAIEIRAQAVRPRQSRYDAVVATSDKAFLGDGPCDKSSPLYVVGARTGRAAEARGWRLAAPPAPHAVQLIERLTGALRVNASVLYLAGRDRKGAIEAALSEKFALEVVEDLRGRSALKLASAGGAGSRVLRRGAALLAPIGRARGRTRQGFWRGGAVSRASPLLPLGRCGRAAQGARRGPHRGRRNA